MSEPLAIYPKPLEHFGVGGRGGTLLKGPTEMGVLCQAQDSTQHFYNHRLKSLSNTLTVITPGGIG